MKNFDGTPVICDKIDGITVTSNLVRPFSPLYEEFLEKPTIINMKVKMNKTITKVLLAITFTKL